MDRLAMFQMLVMMAAVDREIAPSEYRLLLDRAMEWGLDPAAVGETIRIAQEKNKSLRIQIPEVKADRIDLLREVARMMWADGQSVPFERALLESMARYMGIPKAEVDRIAEAEGPPGAAS